MTFDVAGTELAEMSRSWLRGARSGWEELELAKRGWNWPGGIGAAREEPEMPKRSRSFPGGQEEPEMAEGGRAAQGRGEKCSRGATATQTEPDLVKRNQH